MQARHEYMYFSLNSIIKMFLQALIGIYHQTLSNGQETFQQLVIPQTTLGEASILKIIS